MKKLLLAHAAFLGLLCAALAQNPTIPIPGTRVLSDSIPKNGKLDRIEDMSFRAEVPFMMPDGVRLMTDVFLPIFQDSLTFDFDLFGTKANLTILKKGTQYIVYDSIN